MIDILLWVLAVVLVVVGIAGTLFPALPGTLMVFCGLLLAAWIEAFEEVGLLTIAILGLLTVLSYVVEFVASALGAKRVGASPRAFWGAALGSLVGIFFGLPGLILGPFVGAVIGEYSARADVRGATRAGYGAWIGMMVGTVMKLTLAFLMLGIFILMRVV